MALRVEVILFLAPRRGIPCEISPTGGYIVCDYPDVSYFLFTGKGKAYEIRVEPERNYGDDPGLETCNIYTLSPEPNPDEIEKWVFGVNPREDTIIGQSSITKDQLFEELERDFPEIRKIILEVI